MLGDKVYLPAIDELSVFCFYFKFNKLPELANNFNDQPHFYINGTKKYLNYCFWSSTQRSISSAIYCDLKCNTISINIKSFYNYSVLPFLYKI